MWHWLMSLDNDIKNFGFMPVQVSYYSKLPQYILPVQNKL